MRKPVENVSWRSMEAWLLYEAGFGIADLQKRYGLSRQRIHQLLSLGPAPIKPHSRSKQRLPIATIQARKEAVRITLDIAGILTDRGVHWIYATLFGPTQGVVPKFGLSRPYPTRIKLSKRDEIVALWQAGKTGPQIAELLDCTVHRVSVELARARKNGVTIRYQKAGWQNRQIAKQETGDQK